MDALRAIVVALVLTSGVSCGERGDAPRDGGAAARDVGSADTLARPPGVACRETSDCPAPVPACGTSICMGGVCRVAPPDRDSDGHGDRGCQVEDPFFLDDDCDDADPRRFPGNPELCDDHDEDCSLTTFGDLDADGDGEVSAVCCLEDEGEVLCATDSDDADPDVGFRSMEVCNGRDDDCDFEVDEGCGADAGDDAGTDLDAGGDAAAPDGAASWTPAPRWMAVPCRWTRGSWAMSVWSMHRMRAASRRCLPTRCATVATTTATAAPTKAATSLQ
ncbi:MAG: hypothetical protein IT379_08650 [Deltaproteobacteria bacterium]|nr:hypothetical protein [Deltaproteobacteria bacterium]